MKYSFDYTLHDRKKSIDLCVVAVFTGGLFPSPVQTQKIWNLYGSPDYVIAADSGLLCCHEYIDFYKDKNIDFYPDKILGDFDSLLEKDRHLLSEYPNGVVEYFNCDKDFTDTELAIKTAFDFALSSKKTAFPILIGADGGRIDHLLSVYDSFSFENPPSLWLCSHQLVFRLPAGKKCRISEVSIKDNISIVRISSCFDKGKIISKGLEWEGDIFRKKGMPSISNRINSKFLKKGIILEAVDCDFLVIAPLTAFCTFI